MKKLMLEKFIERVKQNDLLVGNNAEFAIEMANDCAEEAESSWEDYTYSRFIYAKCRNCGAIHNVKFSYCPDCGRQMRNADAKKITELNG